MFFNHDHPKLVVENFIDTLANCHFSFSIVQRFQTVSSSEATIFPFRGQQQHTNLVADKFSAVNTLDDH
jgi:hypothetical protein